MTSSGGKKEILIEGPVLSKLPEGRRLLEVLRHMKLISVSTLVCETHLFIIQVICSDNLLRRIPNLFVKVTDGVIRTNFFLKTNSSSTFKILNFQISNLGRKRWCLYRHLNSLCVGDRNCIDDWKQLRLAHLDLLLHIFAVHI